LGGSLDLGRLLEVSGPCRAQACATARPSVSVKVAHQRVRSLAASQAAMSRQVSASAAPWPPTSPGASERPSHADRGMVRLMLPVTAGHHDRPGQPAPGGTPPAAPRPTPSSADAPTGLAPLSAASPEPAP